jgi:archaellum component FlaC
VAFLEGRMVEHSRMMDGIRESIVSLEERMDRRFEAVDRRFDAIDWRFVGIDRRLEGIDRRIEGLDTRVSRQFTWLVGLHVTTLAAVVAALLAR